MDNKIMRSSMVLVSIPLFVIGIGLLIGNHWLKENWLWPDAPWHSDYFMASLFFANAIGLLFCAFNSELRAVFPVAVGSAVSFIGGGMYLLLQAFDHKYDQFRLTIWGDIFILFGICYAMFLLLSWHSKFVNTDKLPFLVRLILALMVIFNLWVGLRLIGIEDAFAWKVTPQMAVIYGWGLFGVSIIAASVMLEPYWSNVRAVFAAFVIYDLILYVPFIDLVLHPNHLPVNFYRLALYFILITVSLIAVIFYSFYRWTSSNRERLRGRARIK